MASAIDQKAYLQKYLGGPKGDKKKKKKKAPKGNGLKIIDDDLDLSKLRPLDGDELDILDEGEDGPQVAGIIDERPEEVRKLEQFKTSSMWRVVTQDDGFNSKLQIEEIKKDVKEIEKENELVFGKMYSDSEDEVEKKNDKNDSDLSPPRSKPSNTNSVDLKKKQQNNSDSDFSPPRKGREASPRKRKSPPRKERDFPKESTSRCQDNDSDLSPPRKNNSHKGEKRDRARKPSRWGDPDDVYTRTSVSPKKSKAERKSRRDSDSDVSLPRKRQKDKHKSHRKESPHKKRSKRREQSSESDLSPPRKRKSPERKSRKDERNDKRDNKDSKKDRSRKDRRDSYDSDMSPPRKNRRKSESPPRRSKEMQKNRKHRNSDSDLSPPRKKDNTGKDRRKDKRNDDSPPPSNKKMERTLEGKMAGLQNAKQLREENNAFRKREEDAFNMMTDDVSGRNAKAVSRKGKRATSEDRQKQREKAERQKMLDEKYKKWSKGLKQIEAENERIEHYVHEAAKPLARMRDDKDLEHSLKQVERAGDPMLAYIREKKRERGELGPEKPSYKGSFPPNRFNIRPGYRWDGVDRSNGYEKKYFEHQSKRKAQEEEAYKWSTEDL